MTATLPTRTTAGQELPAAGVYDIDPGHSRVAFEARHLMLTRTRGHFARFAGAITVAERIEDSTVAVDIEAASVDTANPDRDAHLRANDFLGSDQHPALRFRGVVVEPAAGGRWLVRGDLTIRGVTRPVALDTEFGGGLTDPWGNARVAFFASTTINREDWGITWNLPLEGSGLVVGKEVRIDLEIEATRR